MCSRAPPPRTPWQIPAGEWQQTGMTTKTYCTPAHEAQNYYFTLVVTFFWCQSINSFPDCVLGFVSSSCPPCNIKVPPLHPAGFKGAGENIAHSPLPGRRSFHVLLHSSQSGRWWREESRQRLLWQQESKCTRPQRSGRSRHMWWTRRLRCSIKSPQRPAEKHKAQSEARQGTFFYCILICAFDSFLFVNSDDLLICQ